MTRTLKSLIGLSLLWFACPAAPDSRAAQTIAAGDHFPEVPLAAPADAADRTYLGLQDGKLFTASRIRADVVLVELLNVHCPHCMMQAPSYNELYRRIEGDSSTRGRIKLLGIGVGNLPEEIAAFRRAQRVPFPILPDASFEVLRALGVRATPFSIYLRQERPGTPGVVADTHLGLNTHYEELSVTLRALADAEPAGLRRRAVRSDAAGDAVAPILPGEELRQRVRAALLEAGGTLIRMERLELPSGRQVFEGLLREEEQARTVFAEVIDRPSVCDICHDLHFIYVFDRTGTVLGFLPLHLTKYGNVNWDAADVERMRRRVVGRSLASWRPFDPEVDAVTAATITSAMVFDSLAQGGALLRELAGAGRLRPDPTRAGPP